MLGALRRSVAKAADRHPPGKTSDANLREAGRGCVVVCPSAPGKCLMAGILTLGGLGLSLSVDAFAAAVGKGADGERRNLGKALRIGLVFGLAEAISPAIGWLIGKAAATWIQPIGDWVAFALLVLVGGHMLWEAWRGSHGEALPVEAQAARKKAGTLRLMLTAVATSIDAMAVGISLAVLDVSIVSACVVIGLVTTVIATIGVLAGRKAGETLGPMAEVLGGLALIGIGAVILVQHLMR